MVSALRQAPKATAHMRSDCTVIREECFDRLGVRRTPPHSCARSVHGAVVGVHVVARERVQETLGKAIALRAVCRRRDGYQGAHCGAGREQSFRLERCDSVSDFGAPRTCPSPYLKTLRRQVVATAASVGFWGVLR